LERFGAENAEYLHDVCHNAGYHLWNALKELLKARTPDVFEVTA
jgi:hypothetical protein